jgi:CO/xanthine dehydrogenase Mo-binding subunit
VIGTSIGRRDGRGKVTGATVYSADVHLPGTLRGGILRSLLPYARILRVDTSAARTLPGVHAVLAGVDLPAPLLAGRSLSDVPVLCRDVVRFVGDRVAAVAAETAPALEAALAAIEVEYEELPGAVFDPNEAVRPNAPVLHPDFLSYRGAPKNPLPHPNMCAYERFDKGDLEHGLAEAELVVEHRYRTAMQHQGYLEPHTCLAAYGPDGVVRVWASNKAPFLLRDELARVLDLPKEQVIVEHTYVGGDFGGKGSAMEIPLAALLSHAAGGRPVRVVLSGVDELSAANPRHGSEIVVRSGLNRDGRIVARHVSAVFDGGAYAGFKPIPGVNLAGRFWSVGPYRTPHVRWESTVTYTNHVPGGHMRAPGELQADFAVETDMDRLAAMVGMDPLSFRQLNAVTDGEPGPLGEPWHSVRLKECLTRVREASGWDRRPVEPGVGRGVAVSHCAGGLGGSSARIEVAADGQVTLYTGVNDQGSGSHTMLVQVVAHELCLSSDDVALVVGGTDSAPWDSGSSASRVTFVGGLAAQQAAQNVRTQLAALAAEFLGCPSEQVTMTQAGLVDARTGRALSIKELAVRAIPPDAPLVGEASYMSPTLSEAPSFAALVAEVMVDRETGAVRVRKLTGVYDVGTVLNPMSVRGQLEGGLIQSLGAALMEDIGLGEDGRVGTASLADYKLPTVMDLPECETFLITDAPGDGPYGAKAVGELTNPLLPAAIANAIYDAVGVRICSLPITAEKVFQALREHA